MSESHKTGDLQAARSQHGTTRIGEWVLHPDLGVIRRGRKEVRLNPKSLHVLLVLLDAGDQGVSRNTLLDIVWGENYPTDNVISRAMADLRSAFGEKAGDQRYIRTLPKLGYQLVARQEAVRRSRVPDTHLKRYRHHYFLGAIALAASMLLPRLLQIPETPVMPARVLSGTTPLTSAPGLEHQPRIVPGSDWVVHAVMRRDRNDWDLFRVSMSDGTSQPIAVTPDVHEHGPAVSPAGNEIAYVRFATDRCDVVRQSITLGVPDRVVECTSTFPTLVDWSPGGGTLAYTVPEHIDADGLRRIYAFDLESGEAKPVTDAVSRTGTDFYPRFAPSGGQLAFLRGEPQPDHRTTLWVVDLTTGKETPLTRVPAQMGGMAWLDDQRLIYSTSVAGAMQGRIVDVVSGNISPIDAPGFVHPDYRADDRLLVVAEQRSDRDLALIGRDGDAELIAQSTSDDHGGRFSIDESWIAFISQRSGFDELWLARVDSDAARRLTRFNGAEVRYPDWHPDGNRVLVTVQNGAGERLYQVDVVGDQSVEIITEFSDLTTPRWTEDGWVAGCRDETGWGICVGSDAGARKIADGFYRPDPSGLGNAYVIDDGGALYNLSLTDGSVTKILDGMPGNGRYGWEVHEGTLYFLAGGATGNSAHLLVADLGGGQPETIFSGKMPVADTAISIGRQSGTILLTLFQTSSDDLVIYRDTEL